MTETNPTPLWRAQCPDCHGSGTVDLHATDGALVGRAECGHPIPERQELESAARALIDRLHQWLQVPYATVDRYLGDHDLHHPRVDWRRLYRLNSRTSGVIDRIPLRLGTTRVVIDLRTTPWSCTYDRHGWELHRRD